MKQRFLTADHMMATQARMLGCARLSALVTMVAMLVATAAVATAEQTDYAVVTTDLADVTAARSIGGSTRVAYTQTRAASPNPADATTRRPGRDERVIVAQADGQEKALFDEAVSRIDAGDHEAAQRLLERFVADHPRSRYARPARRYLGALYADIFQPNPDDEALDPPASSAGIATDHETAAQPPSRVEPMERPTADRVLEIPRAVVRQGLDGSALAALRGRVSETLTEQLRSQVGDRVFFAASSAKLGRRARLVLQHQASFLKRMPKTSVLIVGHADDPGASSVNMSLSLERAWAVHARLVEEGIDPGRLNVAGVGREDPIALCGDPACAAHNRRVATEVIGQRITGRRSGARYALESPSRSDDADADARFVTQGEVEAAGWD